MSFDVNNRRYTGCKSKLTEWIRQNILKNCFQCNSFCDIFAGTGVVTESVISDYKTFYINDFLFSNEVVYKAFFKKYDVWIERGRNC